jgi:hypothetical protein
MTKRKTKERNQQIFSSLVEMRQAAVPDADDSDDRESPHGDVLKSPYGDMIESSHGDVIGSPESGNRMKKFRFQLFHEWLTTELAPCRAADIGGGKGLLAYLLRQSGWQATVIDPVYQELPNKYKDIRANKRVMIPATAKVPRISRAFNPAIASQFDLLLGLHAHGCNIQIIDACAANNIGFVLMPCCVIDEPLYPVHGATWVQSLTDYAIRQGFEVRPFRLAFSGQSIGIYAPRRG